MPATYSGTAAEIDKIQERRGIEGNDKRRYVFLWEKGLFKQRPKRTAIKYEYFV